MEKCSLEDNIKEGSFYRKTCELDLSKNITEVNHNIGKTALDRTIAFSDIDIGEQITLTGLFFNIGHKIGNNGFNTIILKNITSINYT